jgi:arginine utilization regulatory protein
VRELLNVLERVLVFAGGGPLLASHLAGLLEKRPGDGGDEGSPVGGVVEDACSLAPLSSLQEVREIASVLAATGGNVSRAARRLNLPRSTLRHRIRHHKLFELIPDD